MVKNPSASTGDTGSIPGPGRSPEEGNGTPVQYSCLEDLRDRGAWWATVHSGSQGVGHDLETDHQQDLRALFGLFWVLHVAYGILVPGPGTEPRPSGSEKAKS